VLLLRHKLFNFQCLPERLRNFVEAFWYLELCTSLLMLLGLLPGKAKLKEFETMVKLL
jgi:hypothetical protein